MFRRRRRRAHQGAVDHGDQSGRLACRDADRGARDPLRCSFVVVSDVTSPPPTRLRHAHVLLPAAAWGEKDGTVTNSERRISRQRAFLPLPGEARPDWWIICEVAQRLGFGDAFAYRGAGGDLRRARARSPASRTTARATSTSPALGGIDADRRYDALDAVPMAAAGVRSGRTDAPVRRRPLLHARRQGALRRRSPRRGWRAASRRRGRSLLNTGRVRDQWHTMTRTGMSPRLSTHIAEPFVEIHPDDAARLGLVQGALARVVDRTARPPCACWSTAGSSRARCSCRSTGRPRTAPARASARWCSPRPIRSPASPSQGDAGPRRLARR